MINTLETRLARKPLISQKYRQAESFFSKNLLISLKVLFKKHGNIYIVYCYVGTLDEIKDLSLQLLGVEWRSSICNEYAEHRPSYCI